MWNVRRFGNIKKNTHWNSSHILMEVLKIQIEDVLTFIWIFEILHFFGSWMIGWVLYMIIYWWMNCWIFPIFLIFLSGMFRWYNLEKILALPNFSSHINRLKFVETETDEQMKWRKKSRQLLFDKSTLLVQNQSFLGFRLRAKINRNSKKWQNNA